MAKSPFSYRLRPWAVAVLLSVAVAFGVIEASRLVIENSHTSELAIEAERRAIEIMAVTLNGNDVGDARGSVDPRRSTYMGESSREIHLSPRHLSALAVRSSGTVRG